ncbi:MAG: nucleotidyltransferase family protein [Candidatus Polarisedimenticolia bacterium]
MSNPQQARTPAAAPAPDGRADLLILLASPAPDRAALRAALEALPEADVPALLQRAAWHRVDGLASRTLERCAPDRVSPWLLSSLRRRRQRRAAATLAQGLALGEILEALGRRDLPVIVLRGLRSVESIYGDPGVRPFEDHDLLVTGREAATARATLLRLRFEEAAPGYFRRGGVFVDLHVDPLGARRRPARAALFPFPTASLFERAVPGLVAGGPALIPRAEDELLLLAVHVVKHSFDRLIRIADLAHRLAAPGTAIDPEALAARAAASRTTRIVAWALRAAAPLGAPLPPPFAGCRGSRLEELLVRRAAALHPLPYCGEILMALAAPGLRARATFLLDALWPRGETPTAALGRTIAFPGRAAGLVKDAARQFAERRSVR